MKQRDRLPNGHFAPGNKASKGHGRPSREREQVYADALRRGISDTDIEAIAVKIKDHILENKNPSAQLIGIIFRYLIPEPTKYSILEIEDTTYNTLSEIIQTLSSRNIDANIFFKDLQRTLDSRYDEIQ
jgi:hypothetical protein